MLHAFIALLAQSTDNPGSQIGDNVKDNLQGFAAAAYIGIVGVMALVFFAGRKISQLAIYLFVAVIVGILIFDPGGFTNIVKSLGESISNGV